MHLYMSGTPRNDPYQVVENRLCTHRLFSMHGAYEQAVLRWLKDVREGVFSAEQYFERYPGARLNANRRDELRREKQREYATIFDPDTREVCDADWHTEEIIEQVCQQTQNIAPYPRFIMLDSGAFTAWNMGEKTTVDEVLRKYAGFIERAEGLFDEIWMINLDVIPGERGRDPTEEELNEATIESDRNFEILVREFGNWILPVFHQGESSARLTECMDQVEGRSDYICVSPRNDLGEGERVKWSMDAHKDIRKARPNMRTHGLATTGNQMIRTVPWYSGDSAAWVQHGGFGMVDIFHDESNCFGAGHNRKAVPHYMNYFLTWDNTRDASLAEGEEAPDGHVGVLAEGKVHEAGKHWYSCGEHTRRHIRQRIERLGFPLPVAAWDSRVRNIICMAEFVAFAQWDETQQKPEAQRNLMEFFS